MSDGEREHLQRIAAEYHQARDIPDRHIEAAIQQWTLPWILSRIATGHRVLELGYGDGVITQALRKQGVTSTVLEGAPSLVASARGLYGPDLDIVHALFEDFAPAARYDVVLALHVLEHVREPVSLLERMTRWLSPGGRLMVIVPNSESIHRRLAVLMRLQPSLDTLGPRDHLVGHRRVYSLEKLVSELRETGYKILESTGFFLKVLPNSMMLDYSPELLDSLFRISTQLPERHLANLAVVATPRGRTGE